jgi:hypothetical protein
MQVDPSASDTRPAAQRVGINYDHIVFNRALLLWSHIILGFAAAMVYLGTHLGHFQYWRTARPLVAVVCSAPGAIPYLISGLLVRRLVTSRLFGTWMFVVVLVGGTGAVAYHYVTRSAEGPHIFDTLIVVVIQTAVFLVAAAICLARKSW